MIAERELLELTLDLSRSLEGEDRFRRLLQALERLLHADAVCLLRSEQDSFVPCASVGLTSDVAGRVFARNEHPRLEAAASSHRPVHFPISTRLPDPFDGLLACDPTGMARVHACLGVPLLVNDRLVGLLCADAREPSAFEHLNDETLLFIGALTAAALRTEQLTARLESSAQKTGHIAQDLVCSASERQGEALIGESSAMRRLREDIALVAPSTMTTLVTGETGVGKELVVRAIHRASSRSHKPLIEINCAALPPSVAESELFGHVRGAFTGAERDRAGKLELANGASLFLDEIGELPLALQPKLLRTLQCGDVQRVGSDRSLRVDVRFLAATNRDLEAEVKAGRFREDLYHRLHVFRIDVPPLRDRLEDIAALSGRFCDEARQRLGLGPIRLTDASRRALSLRSWPGNVRELENAILRVVLRASRGVPRGEPVVVGVEHLSESWRPLSMAAPPTATNPPLGSLAERVDEFRRSAIREALTRTGGNRAAAARSLGLDRSNFHHLLRRLSV